MISAGGNRNVGDYFEKAMVWLAVLYSLLLIISWMMRPMEHMNLTTVLSSK